jgi:hypothetical protein
MHKKVAHPAGSLISFNPQYHAYSCDGVRLKAVSKYLDACFPFDEKKVSGFVAKKTGQSPEDVIRGWKKQATLGKNVHAVIESRLLNAPAPVRHHEELHGDENKYIPVALEAVDRVLSAYDCVAVEQVIASPQLSVAGTIDFVGRNKKTGAILIADWKTSGTTTSSFRFGSFETPALGVLGHLSNGKISRYAMQVLIYGHILRLEGYSKFFGDAVNSLPMEYGIAQLAKNEAGDVVCELREVTVMDALPADSLFETTIEDIINGLLGDGKPTQE